MYFWGKLGLIFGPYFEWCMGGSNQSGSYAELVIPQNPQDLQSVPQHY